MRTSTRVHSLSATLATALVTGGSFVALAGFVSPAAATMLTFDLTPVPTADSSYIHSTDGGANGPLLNTVYGHRGAADSGDGTYTAYSYGGLPADTPNIGVAYSHVRNDSAAFRQDRARFRPTAYASPNAITADGSNWRAVIKFLPDDGSQVVLNSFDVVKGSAWIDTDYTVFVEVWQSIDDTLNFTGNSLSPLGGSLVADTHYTVLFSELRASGLGVDTFDLNVTGAAGTTLWLVVGTPPTGPDSTSTNAVNLGIDNVSFNQLVPEPASLALVGLGAPLMLRRRWF